MMETALIWNWILFVSPININQGEAFTEQGKYVWDMSQISFTAYEEKKVKVIFSQEREDVEGMYLNQMMFGFSPVCWNLGKSN
ncbi:MAG: hypothetical protein U5L96_08865 [Owenweeksia sp.]|nr:hypothetical protein [Owenweeksia sp.]